ncbi:carbohydrate sulfotransferase 8-like isoform X3 [Poecile atricapillus]|uniref:carbohydrate sulfotransferase 8-like isoform X3 n=1 Tax=Poecile atricapillus TaxID=48891 RepID=UPI002738C504|nr:carbohydrate sulfotransferase 8-like isoform X3 [Poecile atricapillus]
MNQRVLAFLLPNFLFGLFLLGFFSKRQKNLTDTFPKNWLAIQNSRKTTLASVCLKNNLNKPGSKLDSHVAYQLFVEHKHKFIYCEVPKVGCSNWKRTIFLLQSNLNTEASEIEHVNIHHTTLIKRLLSYPPALQKEFLSNYTKVMFTRHPFERLVSAYRDKLLHSEPFYSTTVANEIRAMFRKNTNSSEKVSFQEFVNFIIAKPPHSLDIHWKPMFLLCDPCNIHYDVLVFFSQRKLEIIPIKVKFTLKDAVSFS